MPSTGPKTSETQCCEMGRFWENLVAMATTSLRSLVFFKLFKKNKLYKHSENANNFSVTVLPHSLVCVSVILASFM